MIDLYGVLANDLRLCTNVIFNDTSPAFHWVDDSWRSTSVRHLTIAKYNEWISRHKEGDKPWIIAFGSTVYSNPLSTQTTNLMMNKLSCLAELVGDQANFGFIDYS